MANKRRENRRKYGVPHLRHITGGWVAPLQPAQFAGSPQADTQTDSGDNGGDSGGDGGSQ